jgi:hypothetical protein
LTSIPYESHFGIIHMLLRMSFYLTYRRDRYDERVPDHCHVGKISCLPPRESGRHLRARYPNRGALEEVEKPQMLRMFTCLFSCFLRRDPVSLSITLKTPLEDTRVFQV